MQLFIIVSMANSFLITIATTCYVHSLNLLNQFSLQVFKK